MVQADFDKGLYNFYSHISARCDYVMWAMETFDGISTLTSLRDVTRA